MLCSAPHLLQFLLSLRCIQCSGYFNIMQQRLIWNAILMLLSCFPTDSAHYASTPVSLCTYSCTVTIKPFWCSHTGCIPSCVYCDRSSAAQTSPSQLGLAFWTFIYQQTHTQHPRVWLRKHVAIKLIKCDTDRAHNYRLLGYLPRYSFWNMVSQWGSSSQWKPGPFVPMGRNNTFFNYDLMKYKISLVLLDWQAV